MSTETPASEEIQKIDINSDSLAKDIVNEGEIFRGMTQGDFLREWLIWLHSDSPRFRGDRQEICYVHGNLSYIYDKVTGMRKQFEPFQNRATSKGIFRGDVIFNDTPIFVPARSSYYSVGEVYYRDGKKLESIADCQYICRRDLMEGGEGWCRLLMKSGKDGKKLKEVNMDKKLHYVETPSFEMTVTANSPLREYMEMPIKAGTYPTFSCARVLMIRKLDPGRYRLHYGGHGRGGYFSDSIYDIVVASAESVRDSFTMPFKSVQVPNLKEYHLDPFNAD